MRFTASAAWIAATIGLATLGAGPALAHAGNHAQRGIARAEAAGIKIDRAAKRIMAAAPVGSCLNDPTRSKCDRPKAIVGDGRRVAGVTRYSELGPATAALVRPVGRGSVAHTAAVPQCFVKATSLVKSTGSARAYAQNTCTSAVSEQELFVNLNEFWLSDSQWHQMNAGFAGPAGGGRTINAQTSYPCRSSGIRAWADVASGYSDLNGVWYAAQNTRYENLTCVG